jgi:small subunit ribosomal protein S1
VHVSELSWKHVDHPQEVVTVGQEVEVEVLDVDLERERVSLSLKATQEDPWKEFERTSQAGAIISGQVTKLVPFGAFVRVAQGIEGLVHISEISHEHVDTPESVLSVGDEVQVKVIDVDVSRRRVSLSMRQVSAAPAKEPEIRAEPEARREATPELVSTIQIPDDILAAVAEADAARASEPEPAPAATPEPEPSPEPESEEPAVAEVAEAVAEAAIEETQVEEVVDAAIAEATVDDAIVAEAEGDTVTAVADADVAEEAVEAAEEAADEEVSLEAILEDLKRREGRSE